MAYRPSPCSAGIVILGGYRFEAQAEELIKGSPYGPNNLVSSGPFKDNAMELLLNGTKSYLRLLLSVLYVIKSWILSVSHCIKGPPILYFRVIPLLPVICE